MPERAAIFIDGGYLDAILRDQFDGAKIDYQKLVKGLVQDIPVLRTYYYTCEPWQSNPPSEDESKRFAGAQKFHNYLRQLPNYDVRLGRLVKRGQAANGKPILVQKQVDIYMTADFLRLSFRRTITRAVLITGDSDFVPAINMSKDEGVEVFLAHGARPHFTLTSAVDRRIPIDNEFIEKVKR